MLSRIARESDLLALHDSREALNDFFQYLHLEILDQKDRIRLLNRNALPMEVFPPLSRLLRNLIELSELAKDEAQRIELRDKIKRLQTYLADLSEVIDQKNLDVFIGWSGVVVATRLFTCEVHLSKSHRF